MKALLLGSISVLADTSELQRAAFNDAFHEAGLDWYWSRDDYREMLKGSGGQDRIEVFSERTGERVNAAALHRHKTSIFQDMLRNADLDLRTHTAKLLAEAKDQGLTVAVVSGTARESLDALIANLGGQEALGVHLVTSELNNLSPKPDPALYKHALSVFGIDAQHAVAVEDNVLGAAAAVAAGVACYVYPNENTMQHDFGALPHVRDLLMQQAA